MLLICALKYAQVQSNDRPIVLGQPLLTFPINDQAVGTFRRSGSSEDMRRFTRISMAERTINSKPRRHSRDFVRTIVDNQVCKPCGTNVSLQIPSLERPLSFTEFLLSSNYHTFDAAHGNELRESLMSALRTEHVDDPSLEFVTVTPSDIVRRLRLKDDTLREVMRIIKEEMIKGNEGEESYELMMLPVYVNRLPKSFLNGKYLALDLGGTNFRIAEVNFRDDGNIEEQSDFFIRERPKINYF
ncbi:hypothetical protein GJ496_003219 [Pomphorhynchus laevis]|nr:hypothetical protein GJ496_003219 [Pomphorhynchus laevis]